MTDWTSHRVIIAVPAAYQADARVLGRILDPDAGGERMFAEVNFTRADGDWLVACTQLETGLWDLMERGDVSAFAALVAERAQARGKTPPSTTVIGNLYQAAVIRPVPEGMSPMDVLTAEGFTPVPPPGSVQ